MSQSCGCCTPNAPLTPVTIDNRPGLSALAYRIGTYASFRETMLDAIAGTPGIADLTTRQSDDYSITFIELWAALLDVVTFYQERYANEIFLRTAQQTASLERLARLLDYRPRPGVAAEADLAFLLDAGKTVQIPVGLRVQSVPAQNQQPRTYETLETLAADARFNRLRIYPQPHAVNPLALASPGAILDRLSGPGFLAALAPGDPVALFNNGGANPIEEKKVASITAQDDRVALAWTIPVQGSVWSAKSMAFKYRRTFRMFGHTAPPFFMQPTTSTAVPGGILWNQVQTDFSNAGGTALNLDARYSDLTVGTQLLVVMTTPPPKITPIPFPPPILFFQGAQDFEAIQPLELLKAAASPAQAFHIGAQETLKIGGILGGDLGGIFGGLGGQIGPLLPPPPTLVTALVTVTEVSQAAATIGGTDQPANAPGALSDTVTRVTVTPALDAIDDIRGVRIFELVGRQIPFWGFEYDASISSSAVYLSGVLVEAGANLGIEVGRTIQQNAFVPGVAIAPQDIDVGRRVLLQDAAGGTIAAAVQGPALVDPPNGAPGTFGHLIIPLQAESVSLATASAALLGNVVLASDGQTVSNEVLGGGAASASFQSFTLQKQPLTFVPSSAPGGVTSSLQVAVNNVKWAEVPELFGEPLSAQVFSTRTTEAGSTLVQFGGSDFASVLPTGQGNVAATYRWGSGTAGAVGAGSLTTLLDRIAGLSSVTNPLAAEGGADPETMATIRQSAPRTVRTFDRAVSLADFEDLITASGEVAKALATWVWDGYAPAVHLTVAGQNGGTFTDLASIGATLANARDPNHRLRLDNYHPVPILVAAKIWIDAAYSTKDVLAAANQALLAALSFDALSLGESVHLSAIYAVLQGVSGVAGADVTQLGFKQPAGVTNFQAYLDARGVTRLPDSTVAPVQSFLRVFPARTDPTRPGQVQPAELASVETPSQDVTITAQGS